MFHPLALAWPPVTLGVLCGKSGPRWLSFLAATPTIACSTLGIWVLYRLARAMSWSPAAARAAAFLFAFHWLPLGFGATQFPRPISTCLLLGAFLLLARCEGSIVRAVGAGALAAAATCVRWSEAVMLVPLLAFAFWRSRSVRPPPAVFWAHRSSESGCWTLGRGAGPSSASASSSGSPATRTSAGSTPDPTSGTPG
ncbi:MAG: hypothetical protein ABI968_09285 [Acidobacteriota bacterium]